MRSRSSILIYLYFAVAQVASCTVFISEVLPHTDFPLVDFVEFYNDGATAVDLTSTLSRP